MPTIPTGASAALGVRPQASDPFQALLDQQNNDMLVKQRRQKLQPNGEADPNAQYSSSQSYRALLGLGGI